MGLEDLTEQGNDRTKELVVRMGAGGWQQRKKLPSVPLSGGTGAFQADLKCREESGRGSKCASIVSMAACRNIPLAAAKWMRKAQRKEDNGSLWNLSEKILIGS